MKTNILSVFVVFALIMTGITGCVSAATGAGEVYDFKAGEKPRMFLPVNQSVAEWNNFTGLEVTTDDWINVTYQTNSSTVTQYIYVADEEGNVDICWTAVDWLGWVSEYMSPAVNTTYEGVEISVNNDTVENYIPIVPTSLDLSLNGSVEDYDGGVVSVIPISDRNVTIGDLRIWFIADYDEVEEDFVDDLAYNYSGAATIMIAFDDKYYPLGDWGMFYFEDDEVMIQIGGALDDTANTLNYIVVTNYDSLTTASLVAESVRYWNKPGDSVIDRWVTGSKTTFEAYSATSKSTYIVPTNSIVKIDIGKGMFKDYNVVLSPTTYTIDRKWIATFNAEAVADITGISEVTVIEGIYLEQMSVYSFSADTNDDVDVVSINHFVGWSIDNSFEFATKNWYQVGTLTTKVERTGFTLW
jgi:hypothetical protein